MSIESLIQQQIEALNANTAALNKFHATGNNTSQSVVTDTTGSVTSETTEDKADEKSARIAQRKTYVFFKDSKTGQIIAKGDEIPEGDHVAVVRQPKWVELCEKYELNPETGATAEKAEEPEDEDDDLGLDDDDGLGLDDEKEPKYTQEEVKAKLGEVAQKLGREPALKVLKNNGASNFKEVKPEQFDAVYADADKLLKSKEG